MKTYLAQKHRLDQILAALAPTGTTIRIEGGLPVGTIMPQALEPAESKPDAGNIGVNPIVNLGSEDE
jgi:hypothetical protein